MNTRFLKCIPAIVAMSLLNATCKKIDFKPDISYTTLKVMELRTNIPLAGAKVEIYKCKRYYIDFGGCADLALAETMTTDKDGNFQFESRLNAYEVLASQSKYWPGGSGGENLFGGEQPVTDVSLTPVAYTKIHLKRINQHPDGTLIVVGISPDTLFFFGSKATFNLSADTTFTVPSYGNSHNVVSWYFTNSVGTVDTSQTSGQLPSYYINRFDTASVELNY